MREYRGKPIKGGDFVYGSKVTEGHGRCYIFTGNTIFEQTQGNGIGGKLEHYIFYPSDFIEVIPETVGQSTGLKDKNGVEIYCGDIIHIWSDFYAKDMPVAEVFWNEKNVKFDVKSSDGLYNDWLSNGHKQGWFIEAIGNIHDNPELLETK